MTYLDVLVAKNYDESRIIRAMYPGCFVSYYAVDCSEEIALVGPGPVELSVAQQPYCVSEVRLALPSRLCDFTKIPEGTCVRSDGGVYMWRGDTLVPVRNGRDYVTPSFEECYTSSVDWFLV